MKYDLVIPVAAILIPLVNKFTLPYTIKHINFSHIFLVLKSELFSQIIIPSESKITLVDEDKILPGLTSLSVREYLNNYNSKQSSNWYFQQFLKLSMAYYPKLSENYLVWDADFIPLKSLTFFSKDSRIFITKKTEYHYPYFRTMKELLNLEKEVPYSFIAEHMVFSKDCVYELINEIEERNEGIWWKSIIHVIGSKNEIKPQFSEYETYGNYVIKKYPEKYMERTLRTFRHGSHLIGLNPSRLDLLLASTFFEGISFEHKYISIFEKCWKRIKSGWRTFQS